MDGRKDIKPYEVIFKENPKQSYSYAVKFSAVNKTEAKKAFIKEYGTGNIIVSVELNAPNGYKWVKGTKEGYILDNTELHELQVFEYGNYNYDGIIGSCLYTTNINYRNGLISSNSCTGYYASHNDKLIGRKNALNYAIEIITRFCTID